MGRYRYFEILTFIFLGLFLFSCGEGSSLFRSYPHYSGAMDCAKHPWLAKRKIFIDPGHGTKPGGDRFREGPHGVTEEAVNLRVAHILRDMLTRAGAEVTMSRTSPPDVDLEKRVAMARRIKPDILVSIHHNGSPRRCDRVNYPSVLIWGSRYRRPASFDFALILQKEFHRIMDERGEVISDFSVFRETGTRILRKTADICPGIIGEGGFFSEEKHARRLVDINYNVREAEAYFKALSRYFRHGLPSAVVEVTSPVSNSSYLAKMLTEKNPSIYIKIKSDCPTPGAAPGSLHVTLDDVPVRYRPAGPGRYRLLYGKKLYPGGHRIRFSFRNRCGNSSMVLQTSFTVAIAKGDYDSLVRRGRYLLNTGKDVRRALLMLSAAHSMEQTGSGAGSLYHDLYRGFSRLGLHRRARYYHDAYISFYPQSATVRHKRFGSDAPLVPVRYYGKPVPLVSISKK